MGYRIPKILLIVTTVLPFSMGALGNIILCTCNFFFMSPLSGWRKESSFSLISLGPHSAGRLSQKLISDFYLLYFSKQEMQRKGALEACQFWTLHLKAWLSSWQPGHLTWPESLKNQYLRPQQTLWLEARSDMTNSIRCYQSLWQKRLESEKITLWKF